MSWFQILYFQVTTTTKTIREIQYIGPDGQPLDYVPTSTTSSVVGGGHHPRLSTSSAGGNGGYPQIENRSGNNGAPTANPAYFGQQSVAGYANYAEYPHRPPTPPSPSDRSSSPPPQHREPGKLHCAQLQRDLKGHLGHCCPVNSWGRISSMLQQQQN